MKTFKPIHKSVNGFGLKKENGRCFLLCSDLAILLKTHSKKFSYFVLHLEELGDKLLKGQTPQDSLGALLSPVPSGFSFWVISNLAIPLKKHSTKIQQPSAMLRRTLEDAFLVKYLVIR